MLSGDQCREHALAALGREAECADADLRAEWLALSQAWLMLSLIADTQDWTYGHQHRIGDLTDDSVKGASSRFRPA
jgi:hypothetical protein